MIKYPFFSILLIFAYIGSAHGQVYKCISSGKTIFSDAPCPSNSNGTLIQEKRTAEERYEERVRAHEAEQAKNQRKQLEMERNYRERSQQPTIVQHQYQNLPPRQETWAERNESKNRKVSESSIKKNGGKWDEKAEAERKAKERARYGEDRNNSPTNITSCDNGGCWDDQGNRYSGSGLTLFRSDGATCNRIGTMLQCN